jgi:hypothetical protein
MLRCRRTHHSVRAIADRLHFGNVCNRVCPETISPVRPKDSIRSIAGEKKLMKQDMNSDHTAVLRPMLCRMPLEIHAAMFLGRQSHQTQCAATP